MEPCLDPLPIAIARNYSTEGQTKEHLCQIIWKQLLFSDKDIFLFHLNTGKNQPQLHSIVFGGFEPAWANLLDEQRRNILAKFTMHQ